ncbi:conserved exported hypothetical protein [Vibrio chagasii]|nr:conserved exported hypothetical protein [Vibrio chagasii]CAH7250575.1 conserved exported hypothetical protein [Vibrio chagasii]
MKLSMKKSLLLAMSACVFSNVSVAAINGDYDVVDDDLTADHNESNGVPMPFYANGRMQSKLSVSVSFADSDGRPVTVSKSDLEGAISFYLKNSGQELGKDKDCSYGRGCWGYTLNPNDYSHQMGSSYGYSKTLPTSRVSASDTKLTAWVYSNEVAQYREVCMKVKFDAGSQYDNNYYDSCAFPNESTAFYQSVQPKSYSAADFSELGEGELVWEEANADGFYFDKAEMRNFYVTPKDTSVQLVQVAMDNFDESDSDKVFLNDEWLGCYSDCPDDNRSVKGYIFVPGSERNVSDEYVWNSAAGEGRTAVWRVNQQLRSVTLSKLLYSNNATSNNDSQKEYRFTVFDQYGNKGPLKLTYPQSEFTGDGQKWDYTRWTLVSQ